MDPQYWQALANGDRRGALAAVKRLREDGVPLPEIVSDHLLAAQHAVGELWASGEWSVEREHAATSLNEGLLLWLGSFTDAPDPSSPLVVVACVEDERHALAALVVAETLMTYGVRVDYLGPEPDAVELLRHVSQHRPRAVLLSASLTSSLGRATHVVRRLREHGVPVVVGGQAFGDDERRALAIGATAWCASPEDAVRLLEQLPDLVAPVAADDPSAAAAEVAWLEEYRGQVVQYVVEGLRRRDVALTDLADLATWRDDLLGWVDHLVGCVSATLATGDETVMLEAEDWLVHVLAARGLDSGLVTEVLALLAEPLRSRPLASGVLATTIDLLAASGEPTPPAPSASSSTLAGPLPETAPAAQEARLPSGTWPPRTPST